MVYKSLGDYSFCILTTLDFIKPYENIMNLHAFFFYNKKSILLTIFSLYLEGFAILRLPRVDNYLRIPLI